MGTGRMDEEHQKKILIQQAIKLAKDGRWREALALNNKIVSEMQAGVADYNRLGKAYLELGEVAEAQTAGLLVALRTRQPDAATLAACARAMRAHRLAVHA